MSFKLLPAKSFSKEHAWTNSAQLAALTNLICQIIRAVCCHLLLIARNYTHLYQILLFTFICTHWQNHQWHKDLDRFKWKIFRTWLFDSNWWFCLQQYKAKADFVKSLFDSMQWLVSVWDSSDQRASIVAQLAVFSFEEQIVNYFGVLNPDVADNFSFW